jgi:hypothetical protein
LSSEISEDNLEDFHGVERMAFAFSVLDRDYRKKYPSTCPSARLEANASPATCAGARFRKFTKVVGSGKTEVRQILGAACAADCLRAAALSGIVMSNTLF